MTGRILYRQEKGRGKLYCEVLCGLPLIVQNLYAPQGQSEKKIEKRLSRLEQRFTKAQVRSVVLPRDFPYTSLLKWVRPVSELALYQAAAHLLALHLLKEKGILPCRGRIALTAPRVCPELCRTAYLLCEQVREVKIDVPGREGEEFARALQCKFGVPVVPPAVPADVTVSYGGGPGDLFLSEEKIDLCGLCLKAEGVELPTDIESQIMTLLWERGLIKQEMLSVVREG